MSCKPNNNDFNNDVISKLKFIGKIQKGDKINVRFMFVQSDGILTKISRSIINQDNRGNTLNFLQDTINKAFSIISNFEHLTGVADKVMCQNIATDLNLSKTGIHNLKDTYISDNKFCCDMDTLIQVIDARLAEIEYKTRLNKIESNNSFN
jgi:hypothetical protein